MCKRCRNSDTGLKESLGSAQVNNKQGFWFIRHIFVAFLVDFKMHLWCLLCETLLLRECLTLWNRTLSCSTQPVLWGKTACACSSMMKSPLSACLVFKPPLWSSIWSSVCTGRPAAQPPASNRDPVNVANLKVRRDAKIPCCDLEKVPLLQLQCSLSHSFPPWLPSDRGEGGFRSDFWKRPRLFQGGCYTDLRVAQVWYVWKLERREEK